jgi:hypothetical protein
MIPLCDFLWLGREARTPCLIFARNRALAMGAAVR